jgi:hypothetical protein
MERLLIRASILAAPFIMLALFVAVVDPFNLFGVSWIVSEEIKEDTAGELHNALWKLQKFKKAPVSRIILGDSSMAALDTDEIRWLAGEEYFNFAYGGGTLPEAIKTYWLAARMTHLDAVYFGIGFVMFNEYDNLDRVSEARAISENPLLYLSNRVVLHAAFVAVRVALGAAPPRPGAPSLDRDAFWRFQIDESLPEMLYRYKYPATVAAQLLEIAEDCRRHGTRFVVVIPPTELELQRKVVALGRGAEDSQFKRFVATLGPVYDFDYPNSFTAKRENFSDPFHTLDNNEIIEEIWGSRRRYVHESDQARDADPILKSRSQ